ncbi:MAG: c-type cytochrome [Phycisphaerales bacterium]|nr:MAG: c-type cytochrome [Phycisphaerales bacterium]
MTEQEQQSQQHPDRDRLTGHDYDGIEEYDNPLPGWWVWLFTLTIIFAIPYVMWYHLGAGPSIQDNLDAEVEAYGAQLLAIYGDLQPDAPTILDLRSDQAAMAGMAGLFKGKCAQCHVADGSGDVGPNLTDDYWINVRDVTDIATVLTQGVVAKGMPAWDRQLTQTQIVLLSAYVAQLRDNPVAGGKAPQGEFVEPWPQTTIEIVVDEEEPESGTDERLP